MTIAFISDTHFGQKSFNKQVFERQMEYFEQVFFPYVLKNNIKQVIHLGDVVHNRTLIDNWIDGQLKKRFFKWFDENQVNLICLVGNHCTYFKNTVEHNWPRANLKEFEYSEVIDTPTIKIIEGNRFGFMPWMVSLDDRDNIPPIDKVDCLLGHFEISNTLMQGKSISQTGMGYEFFDNYKLVLSGHFHATSQNKNIRYVGSQYQMNWGDYDNERGFWTLDKNLKLKFHINNFSPKYTKLFYSEEDGKVNLFLGGYYDTLRKVSFSEACELVKSNFAKFIIKKYTNQELLSRHFEEYSSNALDKVEIINESSIIEDFDIEKFEETIKDDADLYTIIENYTKNSKFNHDVEQSVLLSKLKTLYERSERKIQEQVA